MIKHALLILVALGAVSFLQAEAPSGHAVLLEKLSEIFKERWDLSVQEDGVVIFTSKKKVRGKAMGYSFGPFEENYNLHFRYRIVPGVSAEQVKKTKEELARLKKSAADIETDPVNKGRVRYLASTAKEWDLVLRIKEHGRALDRAPEFRFKDVFLSEEYAMYFFIPAEESALGKACMKDVRAFYGLLSAIDPITMRRRLLGSEIVE